MRENLNTNARRGQNTGELRAFVRQYAWKDYLHHDPNDRNYRRDMERRIRQMKPEDSDRLLHDDAM